MAGLNEKNNLPEWVGVTPEWVISCTRAALNQLGDWCRKNAGALAISVFATAGVNNALAQALPSNPEYDRIIVEAQKQGKDPVDYAMEKWKSEDWASKLDAYIVKKAVMAKKEEWKKIDIVNDGKREEWKKIDVVNDGKREEWKKIDVVNDGKRGELIKQTKIIITAMKSMESQGRFGPKQIEDINSMYENSGSTEVKDLIKSTFWKYLKTDKVAGL
jgi:hypothetical protein